MRSVLSLVLLGGCFGAGDGVHIGHGTGAYKKWDTAACTCAIEGPEGFYGPAIKLGCTPMFAGGVASTTLYTGLPPSPNVIARVIALDFYDAAAPGVALVETSSDDPTAVWIDALVIEGQGTLENVRMSCGGE